MNKCSDCFLAFSSNFYFIFEIFSLIMLCSLLTNPIILSDGCSKDLEDNYDLSPITSIYLSDEKTSESIQLGYLEEYSSENMEISSKEIYKWKNKYINVKRDQNESPINYISISDNYNLYERFPYTTIKFNSNNYLHYSKESERGKILNDLKISFRKELHTNKKIFTNICFSKNCYINDGSCRIENYRQIDNESSQMLINNNNIELKYNNDIEFYDPETFYLYSRTKITDKAISHIKTIRQLYISFLVLDIAFRIIKLLCACFLKVGDNCCNLLYFIFFFSKLISISLFASIVFLLDPLIDNDKKYFEDSSFYFYNPLILIFESWHFIFCLCLNFQMFSKDPNYCYCCKSDNEDYSETKKSKKNEKNKIEKEIEKIKNEINLCDSENKELNKSLDKIEYEKKILNVNKEKIIVNSLNLKILKLKLNRYKNIDNLIEQTKEKLNERQKKLEEIKNDLNKKIFSLINNLLNGKKLKLNCVYLDEKINAADKFCPSYDFFKLLKNTIDGLFFGIKKQDDFKFIDGQLPHDFKFVLIYSNNDKEKTQFFLDSYNSRFSHILIFTFDKNEFNDLNNNEKVISIESDYNSLLSKLMELDYSCDKDTAQYRPYNLNLFSDYENNEIIKKCHLELLYNTSLNTNSDKLKDKEFQKGLNEKDFLNFVSFLDNDLDDGTPTGIEKIKNKIQQNQKNQQFKIRRDIMRDEEEEKREEKDDIKLNINKINKIEIRQRDDDINNYNNSNVRDSCPNIPNINNIIARNTEDKRENNERIRNENAQIKIGIELKDSVPDINLLENVPNINNINNMRKIRIIDASQESENQELNRMDLFNQIKIRPKKKEKEFLGKINKLEKESIKNSLLKYHNSSENLLKLYTLPGKFYDYLNKWLFTLNLDIYKKIGTITGKIINFLYFLMTAQKKQNKITDKKLYRGLHFKFANIFLYKACEGDIFFYPSFTSTTNNRNVTFTFLNEQKIDLKQLDEDCNCIIEIKNNLGNTDVLQEANIEKYSEIGGEAERLFPPFSFFKIKKVLFDEVKHVGTYLQPFIIELELIKRNFYLDEAIVKNQKIIYDKNNNRWELKK